MRISKPVGAALVCLPMTFAAAPASSQTQAPTDHALVPTLPETVARGPDGSITIRAVRLEQPLTLDGALNEDVYRTFHPAADFIQQYPRSGEPATEETQVWVFFDADHVYVALQAWDSRPDEMVANEMRRDNRNIWLNDNIIVVLDTFLDRRSGFFFQTNPLGGVRDALVINETTTNYDWNTVWDVRSQRSDEGWTAEMAIPFKSMRYEPGAAQVWGFNVMRAVRAKNEQSLLSPVPSTYSANGVMRMSSAATLVGIEAPGDSRNIEVKPYAISTLTTNRPARVSNELDADVGVDAKYGITSSMTVDFTYNTDFAQVEIDEQQVNLTRFNLAFPEKRDFFLEGQGVFDFAGAGGGGGGSPVPQVFFSRRIGISGGTPVPIQAGGRVMGRVGPLSMGLLNIQTEDGPAANAEAANFTVVRLKSDVFNQSNVGLVLTNTSPSLAGEGSNFVYGADATMLFYEHIRLNGYLARSATPGPGGDGDSYRGQAQYDSDRYGLQAEVLRVGDAFNPEVGFLRRTDFTLTSASARFSPRPTSSRYIRRLSWTAGLNRYVNGQHVLETRQESGNFGIELNSSDIFSVDVNRTYEFIEVPFEVAGGLEVPAGQYTFYEVGLGLQLGVQRRISGSVNVSRSGFYTGHRTSLSYAGRAELSSQFALEPRVSFDWISLPTGNTRVTLLGVRPTLTITPRMYVSALAQYNSSTAALETNVRLRWEFAPGSDLFVVYTDGRDTTGRGFSQLLNRGLAVKLTRFFRF